MSLILFGLFGKDPFLSLLSPSVLSYPLSPSMPPPHSYPSPPPLHTSLGTQVASLTKELLVMGELLHRSQDTIGSLRRSDGQAQEWMMMCKALQVEKDGE